MSFSITVEQRTSVTILHVRGKISIGVGDIALRNSFFEVVDEGSRKVVIDMAGVTSVDSSGIGELVSLVTSAHNRAVIIVFAALPRKMKDIFVALQLIDVLTYADSVDAAVEAIKDKSFEEFVATLAYKKID